MKSRRINRRSPLSVLVAAAAAVALSLTGAVSAEANVEPTATIAGTVTREDTGMPVEGVGVFILNTAGGFSFNGYSDANGDYSVTGLAAGEYTVRFAPDFAAPELLSEFWNDAADWISAQRVTVVDGEAVADVDASLQVGGTITGTVTRESDATPLAGATVMLSAHSGSGNSRTVWTGPDGTFRADGLRAGDYSVRFDGPSGSSLTPEYWDDAATGASATPVHVAAGQETGGVDAALGEDAVISGIVTRLSDDSPVQGVVIIAGQDGAQQIAVGADGRYDAEVAPGTYTVQFTAPGQRVLSEYWEDAQLEADATPITVGPGQRLEGIDAELVSVTAITGTALAEGAPTEGLVIEAFADGQQVSSVTTGADGSYALILPAGEYTVRAWGTGLDPVFAAQYYPGATTPQGAVPVELAADADRAGVDFDLARGGNLQGAVRGEGAELPAHGAQVTAYLLNDGAWHPIASTTSYGEYIFWGLDPAAPHDGGPLPAGSYRVGVEADGFCPRFVGGADTVEGADTFQLAAGENLVDLDVTLSAGCETDDRPSFVLSSGSVPAGAEIGVSGSGFPPLTSLQFELHSEPLRLGSLTTDEDGRFTGTLRIPADATVGEHDIVVLSGTAQLASAPLRVTVAAGGESGGAGSARGELANTGAEEQIATAATALGLVFVGLLLAVGRRRRLRS